MNKTMQVHRNLLLNAIIILVVSEISLVPNALAHEGTHFSNRSLLGAYGFWANGFVNGAATPAVRAGIFTFDGEGGCSVVSQANRGTAGSAPSNSSTCTYSVNSDGTGSLTANIPPSFNVFFVITNHGRELQLIRTDTGVIAAGVASKQ